MGNGTCGVAECERDHYARGWCRSHWARWREQGDVQASKPIEPRRKPEMRPCQHCGEAFRVGGRGVHRSLQYCSRLCARKATAPANAVLARAATRRRVDCVHCGASFVPLSARSKYCPECAANDRYRLQRYGITDADWSSMKARHNGACWICRTNEATDVDHNHATGKVRGSLCSRCNKALGYVEDTSWLAAAIKYLEDTAG